jgi:hypothetical protein
MHINPHAQEVPQFAPRDSSGTFTRHCEQLLSGLAIIVRESQIFFSIEGVATYVVKLFPGVWGNALGDKVTAPM